MKIEPSQKRNLFVGLTAIYVVLALTEYMSPSQSRPTGRWAFIMGPIFDLGGSFALIMYWLAISLLLACVGSFMGRNK